jgi:hypothetical protein
MPKFKIQTAEIHRWSESAFSDRLFRIFLLCWSLPLIFVSLYLARYFSLLPSQVPLFYTRSWGEAQLAPKNYLFLPIIGTVLLGIFNLGLATTFHPKDRIISYLLAGTASLVAILAALTLGSIINLMK